MPHMPSYGGEGSACSSSCGSRIVEYTASGLEAPGGFTVPIGTTLADADYHVSFFGVEANGVVVPIAWAFPKVSQTATEFVASFSGDVGDPSSLLTAGAVYKFEIVE